MNVQRIDLYAHYGIPREEGAGGYLTTFVLDPVYEGRKRPAMLVIAGGGYKAVSKREKAPVLLRFPKWRKAVLWLGHSCRSPPHNRRFPHFYFQIQWQSAG